MVGLLLGTINVAAGADQGSITNATFVNTASNSQAGSVTSSPKAADGSSAPKPASAPAPAAAAPAASPVAVKDIPKPSWTSLPLYVNLNNNAVAYARNNPGADGADLIRRQGSVAVAAWFGDWTASPTSAVSSYVSAASAAGAAPVLVLYNIPGRDCSGGYSAGGAANQAVYAQWIQQVAAGIGGKTAVVILEPDALAGIDCLTAAGQTARYSMLQSAVTALKAGGSTSVYLDAGNPGWQTAATMASRLQSAGIANADGFSLNVANTYSTARNQDYGDQLSQLVGGKHYVIDVSRNGNGSVPPADWCNPPAAALGALPTTNTGRKLNDGLLWIKIPWESSGTCNGGPAAGADYWAYAVRQARNAGW